MIPKISAIEKGKLANSGFYQLDNLILNNKLETLYRASQMRKIPHWNFHDDAFGKVNWKIKPNKELSQVYKERAQKLRDSYDYISISFSGGADSWNTLNSFLSNNIHIDEIYTRFALSGTRKHLLANNKDIEPTNYTSEYEYAVKPVLEYVRNNFPKIKITVDDITDDYLNDVKEDEIIRAGHFAFNGMSVKRCANSLSLDVDYENKKVASIRGCGKPQLYLENKNFYLFFNDMEAWPVDADLNFSLEYFYWSPESAELISLQAHLLMEYFKARPQLQYLIERKDLEITPGNTEYTSLRSIDIISATLYDNIVKEVCYPLWNPNTFQTQKNKNVLFDREEDHWILKENTQSVQSWKWAVNQFYTGIHPAAFRIHSSKNPSIATLKSFISNSYLLGSI